MALDCAAKLNRMTHLLSCGTCGLEVQHACRCAPSRPPKPLAAPESPPPKPLVACHSAPQLEDLAAGPRRSSSPTGGERLLAAPEVLVEIVSRHLDGRDLSRLTIAWRRFEEIADERAREAASRVLDARRGGTESAWRKIEP